MQPTTKTIHAAAPESDVRPLVTPIYETSTFVFQSVADLEKYQAGELNGYLYSRYENPTVVAAEQKLIEKHGKAAGVDIKVEFTQLSGGAAAHTIHLPQAILGHRVALQEDGVLPGSRLNVGNSDGIAHDARFSGYRCCNGSGRFR